MRYLVQTDEGHKAEVVPTSREYQGAVETLHINLSEASLFSSPDPTDSTRRVPQLLHPLKGRCESAFSQLDLLSVEDQGRSPIVQELLRFRQERLPHLLASLERESAGPDVGTRLLERLSQDPAHEQRVLKEVMLAIEQKIPSYFRPEKEIGTFEELLNGCVENRAATAVTSSFCDIKSEDSVLVDPSGGRPLFNCNKRVAYTPTDLPTASSVLKSLCSAGTLGEEVVGLNQTALVKLVSRRLWPESNRHLDPRLINELLGYMWKTGGFESLRDQYKRSIVTAGSSFAAAAVLGRDCVSHPVAGSLTLLDYGILGAVGVLSATCIYALHQIRLVSKAAYALASTTASKILEVNTAKILRPGPIAIRALPYTLISHLTAISGGRQRTLLGAGTEESWKIEIPEIFDFDETTVKHEPLESDPKQRVPVLNIQVDDVDDYNARELPKEEVMRLAQGSMPYASYVERSAHAWNIAHAMEVLRAFTEAQNIDNSNSPWLNHGEMLQAGKFTVTNEQGIFPDMRDSFAKLTRYWGLNRVLWDHIALPLHAAYTLERIDQTRKARQIASEVVQREVKKIDKAFV
jgi:hypothetical protein